MDAPDEPAPAARQANRDDLQRIMDTLSTDYAPMGELVNNPLKEALDAGQVFTPAQFRVVDAHFKTFLSSVGCAQSQTEHDANEKKAAEKFANIEAEIKAELFVEWARLESLGLLTPENRTAAATKVWNEKQESSRLANKLEKQREVLKAQCVFRMGIPFCGNRYGTKVHVAEGGDAVLCGKVGFMMCVACKKICYCSEGCQKQHWAAHKSICAKK